jgi:hypothetical protein
MIVEEAPLVDERFEFGLVLVQISCRAFSCQQVDLGHTGNRGTETFSEQWLYVFCLLRAYQITRCHVNQSGAEAGIKLKGG